MNIQLLQWGLFSFMIGLFLSLPLAAVYYGSSPLWKRLITNPRKLKSAHLDFFMQAFAAAFVFIIEMASKTNLPDYVVIPLIFGIIGNPLLLLMEATPLFRSGIRGAFYRVLKVVSPVALLFSWSFIAWTFLPGYLLISLLVIVLIGYLYYTVGKKAQHSGKSLNQK